MSSTFGGGSGSGSGSGGGSSLKKSPFGGGGNSFKPSPFDSPGGSSLKKSPFDSPTSSSGGTSSKKSGYDAPGTASMVIQPETLITTYNKEAPALSTQSFKTHFAPQAPASVITKTKTSSKVTDTFIMTPVAPPSLAGSRNLTVIPKEKPVAFADLMTNAPVLDFTAHYEAEDQANEKFIYIYINIDIILPSY
jgi:hypothetical protein